MQHHLLPYKIKPKHDCVAYWSTSPPKNLIIFIHGFNGSAQKTWKQFQSGLYDYEEFKSSDIIFWGYDSLWVGATTSASLFLKFLDEMNDQPLKYMSREHRRFLKRQNTYSYEKVIIVAHSLGSIITRRALLDAYHGKKTWLGKTGMLLFAPAHNGARKIIFLLLETLTGKVPLVSVAAKFFCPTMDDLKEDSDTVIDIANESKQLIHDGQGAFTISLCVVWAEKERVVKNKRFGEDPNAVTIESKTHTSICKPKLNEGYTRPIELLIEILKRKNS